MKKISLLLLFSLSLLATDLVWSHDYKHALKQAKNTHKIIYVLITSDNCSWCRKFETTTLQDENIKQRLNDEFIVLHLSKEKTKIPMQFKTSPVPRHYFISSKEEILYDSLGHRDVNTFNVFMDFAQDTKQLKEK